MRRHLFTSQPFARLILFIESTYLVNALLRHITQTRKLSVGTIVPLLRGMIRRRLGPFGGEIISESGGGLPRNLHSSSMPQSSSSVRALRWHVT